MCAEHVVVHRLTDDHEWRAGRGLDLLAINTSPLSRTLIQPIVQQLPSVPPKLPSRCAASRRRGWRCTMAMGTESLRVVCNKSWFLFLSWMTAPIILIVLVHHIDHPGRPRFMHALSIASQRVLRRGNHMHHVMYRAHAQRWADQITTSAQEQRASGSNRDTSTSASGETATVWCLCLRPIGKLQPAYIISSGILRFTIGWVAIT